MFIACFWLVVACMLLLTIGQIVLGSAKDHFRSRWEALGTPGLMYFISGAWIFGGRYARALVNFDLARDRALGSSARMIGLIMSILFLTMVGAWITGLISVLSERGK